MTHCRADCALKLVGVGGTVIVDVIVSTSIEIARRTIAAFRSFHCNTSGVAARAFNAERNERGRRIPAEFTLHTFRVVESVLAGLASAAKVRPCRGF